MNPDVRNNPIERENTLPPLSPLKRAAYQSKINTEFANRKITDITEHDLRTLKNSSLGHFLERCLTFITFFWKNKTLIALLHEERETEFLLKAYTKLSKINLEKVEPEGIILPKTSRGKVHHTASLLFIKSIRQEWTIQQFDLIASSKVEKADIHVNKALLRCLRTVAHMSGISIKQKNFFTYFQQLLQELRKITDAEGKNVLEQVETLLKEKKELYRDLSTLYHTQWLLETSALDEEKSHEILKGLFLKHEQEIKDIDTTLPTILQISSAIQALESKVEKIDSFFRSLATTMTDKLSIFETTTDRLAREFSPEVLKKPVHVTMIGVEYSGLIKEGGLSEALEGLAVGMKKQHPDNQVRLIFPRFSSLPQAIREQLSHTPPKEYVDSTGEKINVRSLTINGVECLFIDHPLFSLPQEKPSIYGPTEAEMKTRFVKFSQLASDLLPQLGKTDIIHLHDWHVAGVAIKYKKDHLHEWEEGKTPPIVFTFHNNSRAAQGRYFQSVYNYDPIIQGLIQAGIASENLNAFVETLQIADSATTVSPTFALECQAVDSGEGISFATRDAAEKGKLFGIINGSNPERWNPATDEQLRRWKDPETHVPVDLTFGPDSPDLLEKKEQCKTQLSKWIKNNFPNTPFDEKKPIVTFIGRFDSYQKGLDKLEEAIESTLANGGQFVCMGILEDPAATKILNRLQKKYAQKNVVFIRDFKDPSGRFHFQQGAEDRPGVGSLVRAASEFLCVPSRFEPCGLVQFEGWLFGSLAIGSRVGGLRDTIIPPEKNMARCNGFLFDRDGKSDTSISSIIGQALHMWTELSAEQKKTVVSRVMKEGKKCSWSEAPSGYSPVEKYRFVYENAKKVAELRAMATKTSQDRKVDLLKLFRKVSSQKPSAMANILEEKYLSIHGKSSAKFSELEAAYFAVDAGLRMQATNPYSTDVNFREHQRFGAHYSQDHTHFEVLAPNARTVFVKNLDTNESHPMTMQKDGSWVIDLRNIPVGTRYQYIVNDQTRLDPYGRGTQPTEIGEPPCSVVHDATSYQWSDKAWLSQRAREAGTSKPTSIFEIYPTAWRKKNGNHLTYRELASQLVAHCKKTGYTHVELMGLLDHPCESSWGYQVSSFFAPNKRMGSPDDLKYLIDCLHQNNIGVVMDFIPLHFAIDDYALNTFDGTDQFQPSKTALLFSLREKFFHWGTKFFDYSKKPVRDFLISSAAFWIEEMHIDSLRVDAVHPILLSENTKSARLFLKQLNATIHKNFPGVQTIAEDYSGRLEVTKPFYQDGLGFDMKWNIGWMKHTLDYFSHPPKERHKSYQRIIRAIQSDTSHKMIMAISHDELKEGKSLLKMTKGLSSEEELSNVRSFLGLMYTLPGKKLLFMGSDTASEETWEALIGTKKGVDDVPLSETKKRISEMLFDLSEIYKKPAFFERDSNGDDLTWIEKNDPDRQVVAFRRTSADGRQSFACVHNFSGNHVKEFVIQLPTPGASEEDVAFKEVFNSEDKKYSGSGLTNANIKILKDATERPYAYKIQIPPMASLIIQETQETVIQ